jgi:hypothetical protein
MNYTKKEYCNTILLIADELKLPGYKTMMGMIGYTLPEMTKNLVYDMFLKEYDCYDSDGKLKEVYTMIHSYAIELSENGFVEFKIEK